MPVPVVQLCLLSSCCASTFPSGSSNMLLYSGCSSRVAAIWCVSQHGSSGATGFRMLAQVRVRYVDGFGPHLLDACMLLGGRGRGGQATHTAATGSYLARHQQPSAGIHMPACPSCQLCGCPCCDQRCAVLCIAVSMRWTAGGSRCCYREQTHGEGPALTNIMQMDVSC